MAKVGLAKTGNHQDVANAKLLKIAILAQNCHFGAKLLRLETLPWPDYKRCADPNFADWRSADHFCRLEKCRSGILVIGLKWDLCRSIFAPIGGVPIPFLPSF